MFLFSLASLLFFFVVFSLYKKKTPHTQKKQQQNNNNNKGYRTALRFISPNKYSPRGTAKPRNSTVRPRSSLLRHFITPGVVFNGCGSLNIECRWDKISGSEIIPNLNAFYFLCCVVLPTSIYPACRATFTLPRALSPAENAGKWRWLCKQGNEHTNTKL